MDKLYIIKIGGGVIDDESLLDAFLRDFARLPENKLLVHGGGKLATQTAEKLGIPQQMIDGRRITDTETLRVLTMVYGGLINRQIVARLQAFDCDAIGITGADGNAILAHKRVHPSIDYGWVGDIDRVNTAFFDDLLQKKRVPVAAPLTHDGRGSLLNTNADTIARELAVALAPRYELSLVFTFDKPGVLTNVNDPGSLVSRLDPNDYETLKKEGRIFAGMLPKIDNAFYALGAGVKQVIIGEAANLSDLLAGRGGTTITNG
jgi:acetylglutamate kinase